MSKVVTANMLTTGRVVFLGLNGAWVENVEEAVGYENDDAAEDALVQAQRDQQRAIIVDPFLTSRGPERNGRPMMTLRDTIRAFGPTIRFQPINSGRAGRGAGRPRE